MKDTALHKASDLKRTNRTYGYLWGKNKDILPPIKWHFNNMEEVVGRPIVKGEYGIDIGSGCGYDTYIMAKNNPSVKILSMDLSDGVYKARELTFGLNNVRIIKGSALNVPVKDEIFDFAYSFGVLHHTPHPVNGVREIARIIKKGAAAYLYLYEDHSENRIKYTALKIVSFLRRITTRIPSNIFYFICCLISPFIFILFSLPAGILKKFKTTRSLAEKIPFNFGRHPASLSADLYDRFSAPIEHRFSRKEVFDLLDKNGFSNITIGRMKSTAGWVIWGYKS